VSLLRLQIRVPVWMLLGILYWGLDPESVDDWRLSDRAKQVRDAWIEAMEDPEHPSLGFVTVWAGPPGHHSRSNEVALSCELGERLGLRDETTERLRLGLKKAGPTRLQMPIPGRAEVTIQLLEPLDGVTETAAMVWYSGPGVLASFRFEGDRAVVIESYLAVLCA
jgi:hypothetical protein